MLKVSNRTATITLVFFSASRLPATVLLPSWCIARNIHLFQASRLSSTYSIIGNHNRQEYAGHGPTKVEGPDLDKHTIKGCTAIRSQLSYCFKFPGFWENLNRTWKSWKSGVLVLFFSGWIESMKPWQILCKFYSHVLWKKTKKFVSRLTIFKSMSRSWRRGTRSLCPSGHGRNRVS